MKSKTIKLMMRERAALMNLLPPRKGYWEQKIVAELREKLRKDCEELGIMQGPGNKARWDDKKDEERSYSLKPRILEIIKDELVERHKKEAITDALVVLIDELFSKEEKKERLDGG